MRFCKKPVAIDAVGYTGLNKEEIDEFVGEDLEYNAGAPDVSLVIPTLEGKHIASPGDFIIKGVKGEFYPCKPDIFKMTYGAECDHEHEHHLEENVTCRYSNCKKCGKFICRREETPNA